MKYSGNGSRGNIAPGALLLAAGLGWAATTFCDNVLAHGFAGKRFFPATLATDDPFVADEFSFPTYARSKTAASGEEPATTESSASIDFTKRITSDFAIGVGASYVQLKPEGGDRQSGWDNLSLGLKYQFYKSDEHETILSAGLDWDIVGTGSKRIGAESFSTLTPGFFFGKEMGELPDSIKYLRPLALTGTVGIAIPTKANTVTVDENGDSSVDRHPNVFKLGLAVEYSIPYLQSFVKDVGLPAPFNRMIPIVEFSMAKPLDNGGGPYTATVNPGVIWAGRYFQLGLEAVIPVNGRSGSGTGVLAQLHFFLDDLFPRSIGRPIFGNNP